MGPNRHARSPVGANGQDRRCPQRNIRADALDEFVFGRVRAAQLDPRPDEQLLAAELARLDRTLEAVRSEHDG